MSEGDVVQEAEPAEPKPEAAGTESAAEAAAESEAEASAADEAEPAPEPVRCSLCAATVPRETAFLVNMQKACGPCTKKVEDALAKQRPRGSALVVAALGGLAGALVGAAVWAAVAIVTELEVGYVAVLVGFLAGYGVKLAAREQRGPVLQYVAAALAVVGLLAAKYITFAYFVVKAAHEHGIHPSYFDGRILSAFPDALSDMISAFDALFAFLAIGAAYRVPKPHVVSIMKLI